MRQGAFLSLLGLIATTTAIPAGRQQVLQEQKPPQDDRKKGARVASDAIIPIRFGLKQENIESGYDYLMEISDPDSPKYGRHWSVEEVDGVNESSIVQTINKGWLAVDIPTWQAEKLMTTEYYEYDVEQDGTLRIGCEEYHLPYFITEHVDYVKPGITLSPPLKKEDLPVQRIDVDARPKLMTDDVDPAPKVKTPLSPFPKAFPKDNTTLISMNGTAAADTAIPFKLRNCGSSITPACIRALYGLPFDTVHGLRNGRGNGLGVFEAGGAYSQEDLDRYFATYARNVPKGTHPKLASINGGQAPVPQAQAQGESVIDLDILFSLTYPEKITLYQVVNPGIRATQEQFQKSVTFLTPFLDAIDGSFCTPWERDSGLDCGTEKLTKVVSVSYVGLELAYGERAQRRTCQEILKLSLRGHTLVFASGDYGVAGFPKLTTTGYNGCVTSDLKVNGPNSGRVFNPGFPSNCPFVLSVGGTKMTPDQTIGDEEKVMDFNGANGFSSGGGFSNYFPRPAYQVRAVGNYLRNHVPAYRWYWYNGYSKFTGKSNIGVNGGVYNRGGRGYPDVSANGASFSTFVKGNPAKYLGTSLAAPIWASIISMINTERRRCGKSVVGFIHPVLYRHPEVFNDITSGTNRGCGTDGFPASEGWDPVTGLGTPKYPELLKLFMSLP